MSNLSESLGENIICVVFHRNQNLNEHKNNDIISCDIKLVQQQQGSQEHVAFLSIGETVETRSKQCN